VVPLASIDDLVFGGWDIFEDDCYKAAGTAGVIEPSMLEKVRPDLEKIRPWRRCSISGTSSALPART